MIISGIYEGYIYMKREITKDEERAYRLCHHEFGGWTVKDAAYKMKLSESKVRRLLKSMKSKAPQLFPILTKHQYRVYRFYMRGFSQQIIAKLLRTTQSAICRTFERMKKNGIKGLNMGSRVRIRCHGENDVVSYTPSMDKHIKQKF